MAGKAIQVQRLTKYEGRKWFKWQLVYPPQVEPGQSKDIPDTIKCKEDLFAVMRMYIIPAVQDWAPTTFKVMHMRGGRGQGIKVVWEGEVWRDGKVVPDTSKDHLGEPPFELT